MVDVVDLTEDSDEEEPQRRTLPQRAGKPRPGELSIAALESRRAVQRGASALRSGPAPKRQKCEPQIKDEESGPALLLPSRHEVDSEVTDGDSDEDDCGEDPQMQQKHGLRLQNLRPRGDGTFEASSVSFKIDTQDALPVTIGQGQGILVRMTGEPLGVAKVLAVIQDKDRNVLLALRYGWLARDFVDLSLLQHPPVQPKYPRQMYWQKDLCADGERHVTVERPGSYKDHIPWTSVAGLCTVTPRAQCTEEELLTPVPEERQLSSAGPPEVFFNNSMQYDHTIKRWEHEWAGTQACGSHDLTAPLRIEGREMTMMDVCCGLGTVSLAGRALTEAVRSAAPDDRRGFKTLWAIDKDWENDPKTGVRRPAGFQFPFDTFKETYGRTNIREAVSLQQLAEALEEKERTGADPAWGKLPGKDEVDLLHASPPCQELSMLNQHTDGLKVERVLYPLLDELMTVIEKVAPKFITIEEVDGFLFHNLDLDRKAADGKKERIVVRCIWRLLLPLLDLGYQVDVRIMNSVHYGVPQQRRRLIMFAAKGGYQLPSPPIPWTHWDISGRQKDRDDALLNCPDGSWKSIQVLSAPYLATHSVACPVTAREALQDLPLPLSSSRDGRGGNKVNLSVSDYTEDNQALQSPFARMMWDGKLRTMGTIRYHADMKPATEPFNVANKAQRACYDAPFPCIYGSNSKHTKSQLHPDPAIDRVLTVAERKRLQSIPDDVWLKGAYATQLRLVGNAVPLLLGWAIQGAVLEAASGAPAPKPPFLADRPAWDAPGAAPAAGALEAAEPEADAAGGTIDAEMDDYDLKMEELDNQDSAGGDTELQAAGEVILAEDPLAEEACEEDSSSVDIGRCCREGAGYGQRRNGIKAECVESSVFAATNVKREPMQSAPDLPRFASMQHSQHAQHSEPFGCLSPTWQRAQRGRKRRQPVKREEDDSEQQRGLAGWERLPQDEQRDLTESGPAHRLPRRFAAADDLHCADGAAARRCSQQVTGQGDMAAACCVSAAARQPDQAVARRLERPLFALPENQQESLEHPQRPHPPTTAQRDELSGAGDCIWASEHDVITIDSSQLPSAEASKPHTADDDAIVIDDDTSSGRSSARSSSSDSADNAALSPPTPSPRVSS